MRRGPPCQSPHHHPRRGLLHRAAAGLRDRRRTPVPGLGEALQLRGSGAVGQVERRVHLARRHHKGGQQVVPVGAHPGGPLPPPSRDEILKVLPVAGGEESQEGSPDGECQEDAEGGLLDAPGYVAVPPGPSVVDPLVGRRDP